MPGEANLLLPTDATAGAARIRLVSNLFLGVGLALLLLAVLIVAVMPMVVSPIASGDQFAAVQLMTVSRVFGALVPPLSAALIALAIMLRLSGGDASSRERRRRAAAVLAIVGAALVVLAIIVIWVGTATMPLLRFVPVNTFFVVQLTAAMQLLLPTVAAAPLAAGAAWLLIGAQPTSRSDGPDA